MPSITNLFKSLKNLQNELILLTSFSSISFFLFFFSLKLYITFLVFLSISLIIHIIYLSVRQVESQLSKDIKRLNKITTSLSFNEPSDILFALDFDLTEIDHSKEKAILEMSSFKEYLLILKEVIEEDIRSTETSIDFLILTEIRNMNQKNGKDAYLSFAWIFTMKNKIDKMKTFLSKIEAKQQEVYRLARINTVVFESSELNVIISDRSEIDVCSICLENMEINPKCVILKCKHYFHKDCIDFWLEEKTNCPMCKTELM